MQDFSTQSAVRLLGHSCVRIVFLLTTCLHLLPAQVQKLTLSDCIRLAESVPSAVSIARLETRIATLAVAEAKSAFLPQSVFNGGYVFNSQANGVNRFVALNGTHEYISTANVGIELDTSGRLRAAYARSKIDRDIAQAATQISSRELRRAVTIAYYRLLALRKQTEAANTSLIEARTFEANTNARFKGGEVARADIIKASAQTVSFEQLLAVAQLEARLANQELSSFWTTDTNIPLDLDDTLDQAPPLSLAAPGYLRRTEFLVFDLQKQGFLLDARQARAQLLPQVTFNYQYGIDANRFTYKEHGSAAFASVNMPIFNWFKARRRNDIFVLRSDQVDATRTATQRTFSREFENARARATSLFEQIQLAQSQVKLFEENLRLSKVRYEGGEGPALDVVVAQTQLQQARANFFNTLFLYAAARADLEVAQGQ